MEWRLVLVVVEGGWVGAVIGYICSWGCGVCSCGGREKETRGER